MNRASKKSRVLAVAAAVVAAVLIGAPAAQAADKGGFRSCSINQYVHIATITTGFTSVNVDSWRASASLGTNQAKNWYSDRHAGSWGVSAPSIVGASTSCGS